MADIPNVNPDSPRDQQVANIRRIYGPEKEALGVLAIEIELIDPHETTDFVSRDRSEARR